MYLYPNDYSFKTIQVYGQVHQTGIAGLASDRRNEDLLSTENRTEHRLEGICPFLTPIVHRNERGGHHPCTDSFCRTSGRVVGKRLFGFIGRNRMFQGNDWVGRRERAGHPRWGGNEAKCPKPSPERYQISGGQGTGQGGSEELQVEARRHGPHPPFSVCQGGTPSSGLEIPGRAWCHESYGLCGTDRALPHHRHSGAEGVPPRPDIGHRLHRTGKCEGVCEKRVKRNFMAVNFTAIKFQGNNIFVNTHCHSERSEESRGHPHGCISICYRDSSSLRSSE